MVTNIRSIHPSSSDLNFSSDQENNDVHGSIGVQVFDQKGAEHGSYALLIEVSA